MDEEAIKYVETIMEAFGKIASSSKIFIAAINGYALGGGCELASACDIRIAAERAKIGFPEATLGILPGAGGTQRLPRIIGMGRTAEMILTGEVINAQEALAFGLVTHVVPGEELMGKAEEIVDRVKKASPIGVAGAKNCLYQSACMGQDPGFMYERGNSSKGHQHRLSPRKGGPGGTSRRGCGIYGSVSDHEWLRRLAAHRTVCPGSEALLGRHLPVKGPAFACPLQLLRVPSLYLRQRW